MSTDDKRISLVASTNEENNAFGHVDRNEQRGRQHYHGVCGQGTGLCDGEQFCLPYAYASACLSQLCRMAQVLRGTELHELRLQVRGRQQSVGKGSADPLSPVERQHFQLSAAGGLNTQGR